MKEAELNKLLKNKEPSELTIEELKQIIPKVNDSIIKTNLEKILHAKEFGCDISLPLIFDNSNSEIRNMDWDNIESPFE